MRTHRTHTCHGVGVAAGFAVLAAAAAEQPQATPAAEAQATARPAPAPVYQPAREEAPALRPMHPPIDEIPPMPMPQSRPRSDSDPNLPTYLLSHDVRTERTRAIAPSVASGLAGGEAPGFSGADGAKSTADHAFGKGFGQMQQITNTQDFPWRMNVKLVMHFIDQSGNDQWFVCSGSMADAETVLTAGHCVYARSPNGINIFDWAEDVYVYAGWDGTGNQFDHPDDVVNPYGRAVAVQFLTSNAWIDDGDFDYDMGLIRVTRGVGMMTGWFGWAWGYDCDTIQGRTYNNSSYPAENCGGGLHTGRDMYYWNGDIDRCPGNQLEIDTPGNCLDSFWGGMSGSAAYYFNDNDDRLAHAVVSNSDLDDSSGRFAKMTENFKDAMLDFENDSRGDSFDLQALRTRVAPDIVTAGDTLTDRSHLAINPTNGEKNATFDFGVYLSDNNNISETDTLLSSQFYDRDFGPMSSVNLNMDDLTIPYNTPSGDYWIGVVYEAETDGNFDNNDSDLWDADPITVNGVADLEAVDVLVTNGNTFDQFDVIDIAYEIDNIGGDPSDSLVVEFYASTDQDIDAGDDFLLGIEDHSGLGGGETLSTSTDFTIPDVIEGDYYIGMIVFADDDVDNANNAAHDADPITIVAPCPADLDGDGYVGQEDLGVLLASYGIDDGGDIDGDGDTDQSDLGILLGEYGTNC
jgi:V8-like Glu-specific endopeptidase